MLRDRSMDKLWKGGDLYKDINGQTRNNAEERGNTSEMFTYIER